MRNFWTSPPASGGSLWDFEQVVRAHQGSVFRTLHRLTGPGPQVEDLAQEVFLRLYRALPEFRGDARLSTYLYRITVNVAQDEWKRRRREREHIAPAPQITDEDQLDTWLENQPPDAFAGNHARTPEQLLGDAETAQAVDAALLALPEIERAVLVLYHQEELSYEGIATALHLPVNTVRTHLHRGRKRLSGLVQQRLDVTSHTRVQAVRREPSAEASISSRQRVGGRPSTHRNPVLRSAE